MPQAISVPLRQAILQRRQQGQSLNLIATELNVPFITVRKFWRRVRDLGPDSVAPDYPRCGARLVPLPPYSPDLTPIEEMWSKVEEFLRSTAARTTAAVYDAMGLPQLATRPLRSEPIPVNPRRRGSIQPSLGGVWPPRTAVPGWTSRPYA